MSFESKDVEEQLDMAITAMRTARVDDLKVANAEAQILGKFRSQRARQSVVLLFFATGGLAAIFAVIAIVAPSESVAAELERVVHNGDHGLRHVVQNRVQPNGELNKGVEYFANDDQVRAIYRGVGSQIVYTRRSITTFHPDGSATIEQGWVRELFDWMGFNAKLILQNSRGSHPAKESVEHGVVVDGRALDRYTFDCDFQNPHDQPRHLHLLVFAEPQTQRPVREESFVTGYPETITTWDYPKNDPSLVEGPKVDPNRIYNVNDERRQILSAMVAKGQSKEVHGQKMELKALVVDEHGDATAIVSWDKSYPGNYVVRINGQVVGDAKQTEAEAKRYMVARPFRYQGKQFQDFLGNRSFGERDIRWPTHVRLEIPVVEGLRLIGYARFEDVVPIRCWRMAPLLRPQGRYIWEPGDTTSGKPTKAVAVKG